MSAAESLLLGLAIAAIGGMLLSIAATRVGVPDVGAFLVAGILIHLAGWQPFVPSSSLGQAITVLAASYILFQGGEGLEWQVLRPVWPTVVLLATVGVVITMVVTGAAASAVFGLPAVIGMLLGAVLSATDPAVLIPILRTISVKARIAQVVISESALNDATGAICTWLMLGLAIDGRMTVVDSAVSFVRVAGVGLGIGAAVGIVNVLLVGGARGPLRGLAGGLGLPIAVLAYVCSDALGGSGLMAAFAAGVVVGNHGYLPIAIEDVARRMSREYAEPTSVMVKALLFVGLGANLDLGSFSAGIVPALAIVATLMFVARPLTVLACTALDPAARWSWPERTAFMWTRGTGVVPAALATLLVVQHAPAASLIASVTSLTILLTVLVQGTTLGPLVRRLGLLEPTSTAP